MKSDSEAGEELIGIVERHARLLLKHAADPSGATPLFANALDPVTLAQARFDPDHVNRHALLASTASQQRWLQLLAGLAALLGQPYYKERALAVFRYLLDRQTDESGLLYWGGHTAYNLEKGIIEFAGDKSKVHELKFHYPDYELMWQSDPAGTQRYIEAMWNAHVIDWSRLDFNRHGPYGKSRGPLWTHDYEGGDVFFWGGGLTFVNAGSDLYYAAATLARLTRDEAPMTWAARLARRYVETRQPGIGISGYQFSQSGGSWCDGPAIRGDRAQYQLAPLIPEGHAVYESTLFKPRPVVQRCLLAIGEQGDEAARSYIDWSCEEMAAWGRIAYRRSDNAFVPVLTDGYSIEGLTLGRKGYFGPVGKVFQAIPATSDFFWMYAAGYRLSGDPFLWEMASSIAEGLGAGTICRPDGGARTWSPRAEKADYRLLYGLLELYDATGDKQMLAFARQTGELLALAAFRGEAFENGGRILTDDPLPLALLRLAGVLLDRKEDVPVSWK